jgi:hypothetical protein
MFTDHYIAYVSPLTGKFPETRATKIHAPRATSTSASPAPIGDADAAKTADEILEIFGENEARKGSATAELESAKKELAPLVGEGIMICYEKEGNYGRRVELSVTEV